MKKRIVFIALAALLLAGLITWYATPEQTEYTGFAMGSVLTQTYWSKRSIKRYAVSPAWSARHYIEGIIQGIELGFDPESLFYSGVAPPYVQEIFEASGGAFDPYIGAITKLWNIDSKDDSPPYVPTRQEIEQALQKREFDPGAYGKGLACDGALTGAEYEGVKAAVINLGGNILTYGRKPWNRPFKIALRDPLGGPNDTKGVFTLRGTNFISTSGSYEKYFERDGVRYHHIFDPETGYPACRDPGLVSVTVINDNGALGDMISTACFVLGYEASLDLLETYDCDALFFYEDGDVRPVGGVMMYYEAW